MLSIIVSSYQEEYFYQFTNSVKETIGDDFEYEIIQQWNPGTMGICEAYNKGAEKAQFENLLFVHEDIIFETNNWGSILLEQLEIDNIGCIGLAGSSIKTKFPIGWWDITNRKFLHLNQHTVERGIEQYREDNIKEVKILDGVFIAVKKNIWKANKFNQNNHSFHGYDLEFSLNISKNYKNFVFNEILVTHLSEGKLTKEWYLKLFNIYLDNKNYTVKPTLKEVKHFINYLNMFSF